MPTQLPTPRCSTPAADCAEPAVTACVGCGVPLCARHARYCADGPRCRDCEGEAESEEC